MTLPPVEELLLHRGTMLLLDRVIDFDDQTAICEFTPQANAWYATPDNAMPGWFGIELMAQSIACHAALLSRQAGLSPKPGALLGTRDYKGPLPTFPADRPLNIKVTQTYRGEDGLASYDSLILNTAGEVLGCASLTVFEPKNFMEFLAGEGK